MTAETFIAPRATREWQRADAAHYIHPFTDSGELGEEARIIRRAQGVYLWDNDGNRLLDGMSGLWCVNVGYGREELVRAAAAQMRELPYYNSFFQCATPAAIRFAEELTRIAPPGFNRVFFTGSGSESNDTVVRMLRHYWEVRGQPRRRVIISRENAYHGSTIAGASLGGMAAMHGQGGLPIPDIVHIRQPHHFADGHGMAEDAFGRLCANALRDKIHEIGSENVAGFIGEPVQGAGGVIVPPDNYWREIQIICDEFQIPIVSDEVICGFGRLGRWFGCEYFGFSPKLMPIAKGMTSGYLPMGGVLVHDDIAEVLRVDGGEFFHGFTYGGHPVCAAVGIENLRILREEHIVDTVARETAPYLQRQWATLASHAAVAHVRGVGMVAALELAHSDGRRFACRPAAGMQCRQISLGHGLVMRAVGDTLIIAPPLVISRAEIDELIDKARRTLDEFAARNL